MTRQGRGTNRGGGTVLLHAHLAGVGLDGGEARGLGADAGGDANLRKDGAREGGQSAVVARVIVITCRLDGRRAGRKIIAAARGRTWFTRVPREKAADLPAFTATGVVMEAMADIVTDVTRALECIGAATSAADKAGRAHCRLDRDDSDDRFARGCRLFFVWNSYARADGRNRTTDRNAHPRFENESFHRPSGQNGSF